MKFIVFDTETTGLPKNKKAPVEESELWPYIVQFSWLIFDDSTQKISKINDHIIKLPENMSIPEQSTKIHGITDKKMREKGIDIKEAIAAFISDFLDCQILVAHNIEFDTKIIQAELCRNNLFNWLGSHNKIEYCTMKYGKPICDIKLKSKYHDGYYVKPPKLMELHQKLFKTIPRNLHNSMIDVYVCFRCFHYMIFERDVIDKYKHNELYTYYNDLCNI